MRAEAGEASGPSTPSPRPDASPDASHEDLELGVSLPVLPVPHRRVFADLALPAVLPLVGHGCS